MTDAWTLTLCFATGGVVLIVVSAFWRAQHSQVTDSTIEAFRILGVAFSSIVGWQLHACGSYSRCGNEDGAVKRLIEQWRKSASRLSCQTLLEASHITRAVKGAAAYPGAQWCPIPEAE